MRYLFMNTLQTQSILSSNVASEPANNGTRLSQQADKINENQQTPGGVIDDKYSASSRNDAVVAKVVSISLKNSVGVSVGAANTSDSPNTVSESFEKLNEAPSFESGVKQITENVLGFVGKALHNLATQEYSAEQLSFYKSEALKGVEVGIDQAKLELIGIADDATFKSIDRIKDAIFDGVKGIDIEGIIANSQQKSASLAEFNNIDIKLSDFNTASIDFENSINDSNLNNQDTSIYTTSTSGISFSIERSESNVSSLGQARAVSSEKLAEIVNQTDALLDSFYRSEISEHYTKSQMSGYSDQEIINSNPDDLPESPRKVAEYLSKYLGVIESSKQVVESEQDFNEIINGLVNQMKDVQVPDLLQAINKFHSFNRKFD